MSTSLTPRKHSTAERRREAIMETAERAFAARGLHGTPTAEIAKAAGISHAYLFRLYPSKAALFGALTDRCNERVYRTFEDAAQTARARGEDVLAAMGQAYAGLLADRTLLLNQLHAFAACDEPAVRAQMRASFAELLELVQRESGADAEQVRGLFAQAMLLNVLAATGTEDVDAPWASVLLGPAADRAGARG